LSEQEPTLKPGSEVSKTEEENNAEVIDPRAGYVQEKIDELGYGDRLNGVGRQAFMEARGRDYDQLQATKNAELAVDAEAAKAVAADGAAEAEARADEMQRRADLEGKARDDAEKQFNDLSWRDKQEINPGGDSAVLKELFRRNVAEAEKGSEEARQKAEQSAETADQEQEAIHQAQQERETKETQAQRERDQAIVEAADKSTSAFQRRIALSDTGAVPNLAVLSNDDIDKMVAYFK
jgi:hypothetical protein